MRHDRTSPRRTTELARPAPARTGGERVRADALVTGRGGGRPLDAKTRTYMESRFGHSFADVRVHADAEANRSARALHANAYTVGSDVAFRGGRYAPGTLEGLALLGHELAHVVQQDGAALPADGVLDVSRPGDAAETAARAAGGQAMAGLSARGAVVAGSAATVSVQCEDEDEPGNGMFWNSPIFKGLATAAGYIPGMGGSAARLLNTPFATTRAVEGAVEDDPMKAISNTLSFFSGGMSGLAALSGYSALGAGGLSGLATTLGSQGIGTLGTVGGLGPTAGLTLPASSVFGGVGLQGGAALGPIAAVVGSFGAGLAAGNWAYHNTDVGPDSVRSMGLIDQGLGVLTGYPRDRSFLQDQGSAAQSSLQEGDVTMAMAHGAVPAAASLLGAAGGLGLDGGMTRTLLSLLDD